MGFLSNLLNPVKAVESAVGAVGSLLGGGSSGNPLQSLESLFGGGDSIGGQSASSSDSSGSSLMCIAQLASLFA